MKMNMRRFAAIMLLIVLVLTTFVCIRHENASNAATGTVTRGEWIHNLVTTFEMSLDESSLPDNYYADMAEGDTYYDDVMLAVGYGVVDLEAGKNFEPEGAVTREFATHTLNFCLGYQLDEGATYSFSDSAGCAYPADAQVAINRGWVSLVGGKFVPSQTLTQTESETMLADAKAVLAETVIDTSHENSWTIKSGVIEVPQYIEVSVADDVVTIVECPVTIEKDDIFVIYQGDIAVPYKAVEVSASDSETAITVEEVEYEDAFDAVSAEGTIESDQLTFEAAEGVELEVENEEVATDGSSTQSIMGRQGNVVNLIVPWQLNNVIIISFL